MEQIAKATLLVKWDKRPPEYIEVQYNPTEKLSLQVERELTGFPPVLLGSARSAGRA